MSLWPTGHSRTCAGQIINKVLVQLYPTVGTEGHQTQPMVIFTVPECIIGIDILSRWQNPHIGFLACEVRNIMVGKAK